MKIDLDELERRARAADKDNPGMCYGADHVDGYPSAQSAMDLFNAMDPATTISLIRRIRELEQALEGQLGKGPSVLRALLEKGATQCGGWDAAGNWDIDRPADGRSGPVTR